jgi:hypothetical protein
MKSATILRTSRDSSIVLGRRGSVQSRLATKVPAVVSTERIRILPSKHALILSPRNYLEICTNFTRMVSDFRKS